MAVFSSVLGVTVGTVRLPAHRSVLLRPSTKTLNYPERCSNDVVIASRSRISARLRSLNFPTNACLVLFLQSQLFLHFFLPLLLRPLADEYDVQFKFPFLAIKKGEVSGETGGGGNFREIDLNLENIFNDHRATPPPDWSRNFTDILRTFSISKYLEN